MKVQIPPPTADLQALTSSPYRQPMLLASYMSFRRNVRIHNQTGLCIFHFFLHQWWYFILSLCPFAFLFYILFGG